MKKDVCMIAHRGYSACYPDNTEIAFIRAAENGSGGAETDVRLTKDGVYVLNHNDEVVFEDGTELLVAEHTYAELAAKPMKNEKSADADIRIIPGGLQTLSGMRLFHRRILSKHNRRND